MPHIPTRVPCNEKFHYYNLPVHIQDTGRRRVTQKPFRMAEGSLSSFAAIKLIYVKLTVILLKIKKITVVSMANVYYI